MFKLLLGLLGKGSGGKSVAGNLAWDIREAIKGKELDPEKLIELQTKINAVEAQHRTLFVAGWRPFIGWICGVALAYNFVIRDLFIWITKLYANAKPHIQPTKGRHPATNKVLCEASTILIFVCNSISFSGPNSLPFIASLISQAKPPATDFLPSPPFKRPKINFHIY